MSRIKEIQDRLAKATKGEWLIERIDEEPGVTNLSVYNNFGETIVTSNDILNPSVFKDIKFIANSKSDIEFLLKELEDCHHLIKELGRIARQGLGQE